MSHDEKGDPLLVICAVTDISGRPIPGVKVDIWETDSSGHYDVQHPGRTKPDGRCVIEGDANGRFWLKAIVPVPYPIPHDGPVGKLLERINRHCWRPAHMHFMFDKPGYDRLITHVAANIPIDLHFANTVKGRCISKGILMKHLMRFLGSRKASS